jgi:hypothetical protein
MAVARTPFTERIGTGTDINLNMKRPRNIYAGGVYRPTLLPSDALGYLSPPRQIVHPPAHQQPFALTSFESITGPVDFNAAQGVERGVHAYALCLTLVVPEKHRKPNNSGEFYA